MNPELRFRGKRFSMVVPLGEGGVVPADGGANLEETARSQRTALSDYAGDKLVRLTVDAFYDGWRDRRNVWPEILELHELAMGEDDGTPPPDFTATGPMPFSGWRFQLAWPEWADEPKPARSTGGALLRQALTLTLVEFNGANGVRFGRRRKGGGNGSGGTTAPASIVLPHEMTLTEVATRYLEDPGKASAIGKINGIRDVRKPLPKGRHLKLPGG